MEDDDVEGEVSASCEGHHVDAETEVERIAINSILNWNTEAEKLSNADPTRVAERS